MRGAAGSGARFAAPADAVVDDQHDDHADHSARKAAQIELVSRSPMPSTSVNRKYPSSDPMIPKNTVRMKP